MASGSGEIWGTWEDFVVAELVARYGPRWDIVVDELRRRVSPAAASNFTPQNCEQRFNELRRRFAPDDPDIDGGVFPRDIPWTEDLRILRLEQLRRELENSGVSLGDLGLKFEQLKEERERKRKADPSRELDLKAASSGSGARDSVSGGNSQSKPAVEDAPDPTAAGDDKVASCNGSTETIAKGETGASLPVDAGVGRRRELADSAAQSKEGEGDKENSDVQISASLSKGRRRNRRSKVAPGVEDAGQLSQPKEGASQPLVAFLKSHGTELERVLLNMDMVKYSSIVRRPVDMDMVRAKLAGGAYSSHEFFRDLLLLCINAIVVFPKGSRECIAAVRLRNLVLLETRKKLPPPDKEELGVKRSSISVKPAVPLPLVLATESKVEKDEKPKPDGDQKDSDGDDEFLAKKLSVKRPKNRRRSSAAALNALIIAPQLLALPPTPAPAPKLSPASGENRPTPLAKLNPLPKPKKKSSGATSGAGSSLAKKRGAATFLNRIKEKSPPPSSPPLLPSTNLLESLKGASSSGNAGKRQEMKKDGEKGEGKKELAPPLKEEATVPPLPVKRVKEEVAATVMKVREEMAATVIPPPLKRVNEEAAGSSKRGEEW